jgi:hypothetical protein
MWYSIHGGEDAVRSLTRVGDIGYSPETVEANMEKHFRLAHKWGCVLLLDEADEFLAKRNVSEYMIYYQWRK